MPTTIHNLLRSRKSVLSQVIALLNCDDCEPEALRADALQSPGQPGPSPILASRFAYSTEPCRTAVTIVCTDCEERLFLVVTLIDRPASSSGRGGIG
jgi:hypothetical protein